ncbi:hypothetical protein CENSYa_1395 [Cenarchaeum symbiosum A]|uniref:Uncharacterized protein n=1 Tax=Cenarchaeum symbiosum (strain A) TaxID=414004 RepID=A0RXF1_CENSY|nr:hypothetical protein CENSYa_1395 [Cenarchaeum symbiosum A]
MRAARLSAWFFLRLFAPRLAGPPVQGRYTRRIFAAPRGMHYLRQQPRLLRQRPDTRPRGHPRCSAPPGLPSEAALSVLPAMPGVRTGRLVCRARGFPGGLPDGAWTKCAHHRSSPPPGAPCRLLGPGACFFPAPHTRLCSMRPKPHNVDTLLHISALPESTQAWRSNWIPWSGDGHLVPSLSAPPCRGGLCAITMHGSTCRVRSNPCVI